MDVRTVFVVLNFVVESEERVVRGLRKGTSIAETDCESLDL